MSALGQGRSQEPGPKQRPVYVLVLDSSGSMGQSVGRVVQAWVAQLCHNFNLSPSTLIAVVTFHSYTEVAYVGTLQGALHAEELTSLRSQGGTKMEDTPAMLHRVLCDFPRLLREQVRLRLRRHRELYGRAAEEALAEAAEAEQLFSLDDFLFLFHVTMVSDGEVWDRNIVLEKMKSEFHANFPLSTVANMLLMRVQTSSYAAPDTTALAALSLVCAHPVPVIECENGS